MYRDRRVSRVPLLALGVGLSLIVAGCGDDDNEKSASPPPPPAPAQKITVPADPDGALKFTKAKLEANSGKVTLEMPNPSKISHGIGVEGKGVDVHGPVVETGKTSTATAELAPGTYEYYCTVKSHHDAGMEGTLVVK